MFLVLFLLRDALPLQHSCNDKLSLTRVAAVEDAAFLFAHVPKTAGTTFRFIIANNTHHASEAKVKGNWGKHVEFESGKSYFQHLTRGKNVAGLINAAAENNTRLLVAGLVRSPVERVKSRFFWLRALHNDWDHCMKGRPYSFSQFIETIEPPNLQYQVYIAGFLRGVKCACPQERCHERNWRFTTEAMSWEELCLSEIEFRRRVQQILITKYVLMGTTELFDVSAVLLGHKMGYTDLGYWKEKKVHGVPQLTAEEQAMVLHANKLDLILWQEATKLISKLVLCLGPSLNNTLTPYIKFQQARAACIEQDLNEGPICGARPPVDWATYTTYEVPVPCRNASVACDHEAPCTVAGAGSHHAADREKVLRSTTGSTLLATGDMPLSSLARIKLERECVEVTPWWLHYWFIGGTLALFAAVLLVVCPSRRAHPIAHGIGSFDNKFVN